jgi:hypothetical protein
VGSGTRPTQKQYKKRYVPSQPGFASWLANSCGGGGGSLLSKSDEDNGVFYSLYRTSRCAPSEKLY